MRITDLLDKKSVTLDLVASTKMEAIDKMVDLVGNSGNLNNKEEYKKAIIAREEMSTTGIGEGVAIPLSLIHIYIGIKDGKIVGIGKAGNPDIMDGVDHNMVVGASTEALSAEGAIVTAGGIDTHIHFISPQQIPTALYSGITTMIGGGVGPSDGTNATTCTPGPWNMERMLEAAEEYPINLGFYGKGNCSTPGALEEQILAGAVGLKIHEDLSLIHI